MENLFVTYLSLILIIIIGYKLTAFDDKIFGFFITDIIKDFLQIYFYDSFLLLKFDKLLTFFLQFK